MKLTPQEVKSLLTKYYVDYKTNLISRNNMKNIFESIIKADVPDDLVLYFKDEIAKLNPPKSMRLPQ